MTSIEWTDATWNPLVGCTRVSKGCEHCYAEGVAHRGMSPHHRGLTVLAPHGKGPRWNGTVRFVPEALLKPTTWRKPRLVFVNSMSDLFHESVPFEQIAAAFGVMAACPQHAFQVLTKRPERAREFFRWIVEQDTGIGDLDGCTPGLLHACSEALSAELRYKLGETLACEHSADPGGPWPLPNVWLGVSVEDQETADERIPVLLELPAAIRWVSYEPALGPVDFRRWMSGRESIPGVIAPSVGFRVAPRLDWIVVGGESGPRARPFDLAWARSVIAQGRAAGVPVFVKQVGAKPIITEDITEVLRLRCGHTIANQIATLRLRDRKGGDPAEWPEDLRVREWPEVTP